jgi:hypothetical protein
MLRGPFVPLSVAPSISYRRCAPTLWCGELGIEVVGMLLCCTSPQVEPRPEPLRIVRGLDRTDRHGYTPVASVLRHGTKP